MPQHTIQSRHSRIAVHISLSRVGRYPSTPTLESLRAQFDLALRIFNILDRKVCVGCAANTTKFNTHITKR